MEMYNYLEEVTADVLEYIRENEIKVTPENRAEVEAALRDDLFIADSVTGNGSGSYTFNAWRADEYLCHNLGLLSEACEWFGCDYTDMLSKACDVTIRCYMLPKAISAALDEIL